jgi:hypothetical protein
MARKDAQRFGEWHRLQAHGQGAEGLPGVVAAVRDGLAAEVFLSRLPRQHDVDMWVGPESGDLDLSEADLAQRGVAEPTSAHADDALIRAIVGTDAELRFLPAATAQPLPADHICATLR